MCHNSIFSHVSHSPIFSHLSPHFSCSVVRLGIPEVEALVAEGTALKLKPTEIEQAKERLAEARSWRDEAASFLAVNAPVTADSLGMLEDVSLTAPIFSFVTFPISHMCHTPCIFS